MSTSVRFIFTFCCSIPLLELAKLSEAAREAKRLVPLTIIAEGVWNYYIGPHGTKLVKITDEKLARFLTGLDLKAYIGRCAGDE